MLLRTLWVKRNVGRGTPTFNFLVYAIIFGRAPANKWRILNSRENVEKSAFFFFGYYAGEQLAKFENTVTIKGNA